MARPETPEDYQGSPDDVVLARRVAGYGHVRLEPNELQPGMPECDCHPADPERPETSLGIIHPDDVIKMRRGEVVGFFRDMAEGPVWNSGRVDFEYAGEVDGTNLYDDRRNAQRSAKSAAKEAAATPAIAPEPAAAPSAEQAHQ